MVEESDETEPPAPPSLSDDTNAKLAGAVHRGFLSQVRHLGPANIHHYFSLVKSLCPVQEEEWSALEEEMLKVVSRAPKLKVFCLTGKSSYYKRGNLVLVAYVRQSGVDGSPLVTKVTEVKDEVISLQLDSTLQVASFNHGHLVIEMRKKEPTGSVVASVEIPLSGVPTEMKETTVDLLAEAKGHRQSMVSMVFGGESSDSLSLMLGREETGVDCSKEVPRVLQSHLSSKIEQILQVTLPMGEYPGPTYNIKIEQVHNKSGSVFTYSHHSYSEDGTKEEVSQSKGDKNSLECPMQCLVTDRLMITAEKRKRSLNAASPSRESTSPVRMRAKGSLAEMSEMASEVAGMFSPGSKKGDEESCCPPVGMERLAPTLFSRSEEVLVVEGKPGDEWRMKLSPQGNLLTLEELRQVHNYNIITIIATIIIIVTIIIIITMVIC